MASYWIMEPPASRNSSAESARIIRDGFSVVAFIVPPLWLLWHRLWIEAAVVFAIGLGFTALSEALGLGIAASALSLLMSLFVGLEGPALWAAALRRRGWREWGVVEASSVAEAEIRYATAVEDHENDHGPVAAPSFMPPWSGTGHTGPALGLLGYPGRA